jgi:hypothetical protein
MEREQFLKELEEIERMKKELNLSATTIFTLHLLLLIEENFISYDEYKFYLIEGKLSQRGESEGQLPTE